MTLVRFNTAMPELSSIMNNLFDRSPLYCGSEATTATIPAVNIGETNDHYVLEMAAPGYKKEDFKVEVNNHLLTISAQIADENGEQKDFYKRQEFAIKSFSRTFNLHKTRIDDAQIEATYRNGILTVQLAKQEEAKPKPARQIDVA